MSRHFVILQNTPNDKIIEKFTNLNSISIKSINKEDYSCEILSRDGTIFSVFDESWQRLYCILPDVFHISFAGLLDLLFEIEPELPTDFFEAICGKFNAPSMYQDSGICMLEVVGKVGEILPPQINIDPNYFANHIKKNHIAIGGITKISEDDGREFVYFYCDGFSLGPDYGLDYSKLVSHMIDKENFDLYYTGGPNDAEPVKFLYHGLVYYSGVSLEKQIRACSIVAGISYEEMYQRMKKISR